MQSKCSLEKEIARISFTMDEVRLFLDTHPCERQALAAYCELRKKREKLLESYERLYGPLEAYRAGADKEKWDWVAAAWPWEKEV